MSTQFRAGRSSLWQQRLAKVLLYQGPVLTIVGLALLVPLVIAAWDARGLPPWQEIYSFLVPAIVGIGSGSLIRWRTVDLTAPLSTNEALLVTTAAWWTTGLLAAIPFILLLGTPSLDALFESISGFTTAGTTMLTQLDTLPRSILLWRSIIQWLGGLGILLIVLIVGRAQGNNALSLLSAEGVKVSSGRLSLNFKQAAYRFIIIYVFLTVAQLILTRLLGMSLFDAASHAMTTVSTGGFSPHDESIAFYRNHSEQFPLFVWIELVVIVFMIAGGVNFYVLYRLGRRQISALWDGLEMRLLWAVIGITTLVVAINSLFTYGGGVADWFLRSLFEIASIISTTGYETTATGSFPRLSKELFLLLMIIGGCAGSTAGGIKLIRLGLLSRFLGYEVRNLRSSPHAVHVPTIDGQPVREQAFRQVVFILILWLLYIAIGGLIITYLAPDLPIVDAYSTVFTAIGVFGPSFIPVDAVIALPDLAKVIFIIGMLAGRLEILPLLVFFNINAWRR
jgi:trk system potassium uptake protein TrkH